MWVWVLLFVTFFVTKGGWVVDKWQLTLWTEMNLSLGVVVCFTLGDFWNDYMQVSSEMNPPLVTADYYLHMYYIKENLDILSMCDIVSFSWKKKQEIFKKILSDLEKVVTVLNSA